MTTAPALIAGCSLLVSTDGLVGTSAEVAAEAGDARAVLDARDSAPPSDGASPDGDGDGAIAKPFCASQSPKPMFCADFDTGVLSDFKNLSGTVSLESSVSSSPPRSMLAVVQGSSAERNAAINQGFPGIPASYETSFDVYVTEYDAGHDVELVVVRLESSGSANCTPGVSIRNSVWTFDEYCVQNDTAVVSVVHPTTVTVAVARWVHISASVTFSPARTYSLSIDEQKIFDARPLTAGLVSGSVSLHAGISYLQGSAGTARIHFDNIRFDFR
jgi:hypothetical protein